MSAPAFTDHFAPVAASYADFRPRYPADLFAWLADIAPGHDLAWDCACGNGQASLDLARHFRRVVATDASAAQLAGATAHEAVEYRLAPAEASGLPDASVDLIGVAQALHWFDLDRFHAEARRVLRPGGVLAAWSYGILRVEGEAVDALVQRFYSEVVGPYWPPERRHVENGYRDLPFPFKELSSQSPGRPKIDLAPSVAVAASAALRIRPAPCGCTGDGSDRRDEPGAQPNAPAFAMTARWDLTGLLGYFRSWSATGRFIADRGEDPVAALAVELSPLWGDPEMTRQVSWPLSLRVGSK